MSKHETTAVTLELVEEAEPILQRLQNDFVVNPFGIDLSFASCFLEWSINFCTAAKIDLRLKKLAQEVAELKLDLERGKLKLERFTKIR